jgi:hypothetical protein
MIRSRWHFSDEDIAIKEMRRLNQKPTTDNERIIRNSRGIFQTISYFSAIKAVSIE